MTERKSEIPVRREVRDKLRESKGLKSWDMYLEELHDTAKHLKKSAESFGSQRSV